MGKRRKRIFDRDFKIEVSKMAIEDNVSVANLGKSYGIAVQVIYRWIDEYKLYGEDAFVGTGNLRQEDAKIKELEKELEEAKLEIEILKKTAKYFLKKQGKE